MEADDNLINKDLAYANFLPTVSAGPAYSVSQRGSSNNRESFNCALRT